MTPPPTFGFDETFIPFSPPPTDMPGLIIPVSDGALVIPLIVIFIGAIALAMRWIERATR